MDQLQSIEGCLKDICLKLGISEAQHIDMGTPDERRRRLLRMTISALQRVDDGDAAMSLFDASSLSAEDRAVNALSHRMGVYVPSELR